MKTCVWKITITKREEKAQILQWRSTSPRNNARDSKQKVVGAQHLPIADTIRRGAEMQ